MKGKKHHTRDSARASWLMAYGAFRKEIAEKNRSFSDTDTTHLRMNLVGLSLCE